jgi:hypothetical protein
MLLTPFEEAACMSTNEYERFVADLESNEALRVEAAESALASLVAFAVSKGYAVTIDQVRKHAAVVESVLSDAELAGVSAGSFVKTTPELVDASELARVRDSLEGKP